MKYQSLFADQSSAVNQKIQTPNVAMLKTISSKVLFISTSYGKKAKLVADGDFIKVKEPIPNNEIQYTATTKLTEITSDYYTSGLHTNEFGATMTSHTFDESTGEGVITFNSDVISIGRSAFRGCTGLTIIDIPSSVISISRGAFYGCTGLTSIDIPDSVTSIGVSAFSGCTSLTSIDIPSSVTSIGDNTFYGCTSLTSIEILDSVTSIGEFAFYGCTSLTSIEIPSSVTSIGDYAFNGCSGLTSITVNKNNTVYNDGNGSNCIIKTSTNELIFGCKTTVIPDSVTSIGDYTFLYCRSLTSIEIPDSVTSIGLGAFKGCTGLTSINIPNSVTSIGNYALSDCYSLTSVILPSSVTSIGNAVFKYDYTSGNTYKLYLDSEDYYNTYIANNSTIGLKNWQIYIAGEYYGTVQTGY